ncbi:Kelch repeat type 2 [Arabidopsis thaliana x Arabidopsis arenosa]|uniref:Kelch repeat type 2 n=1 Tax=Arabidopsis thaliana x Arabidopsis arenosa TaxID=1240361 RepID=A0A8T1XII7_9BRAS|nr:Kelch repeat type 2 [Arabidopsis thaliana x Arabidopsis arenosa]
MSSLEKKRKRKTTTTTNKKKPSPNPSLPADLLISIFARVSRLYYPTLSLVSKSFRSLLTSPELYKARSLSGQTECCCLYVCLRFKPYSNSTWFTLCRKPDQTLTNETTKNKSSGYVLAKVPIPPSPRAHFSSLVAVGSNIYNIGVSKSIYQPSSSVSILDCRTHTWREAPSLRVVPMSLSASVLDGKIYVAGSYKDDYGDSGSWKNLFEVFDTKTQIWDPDTIPCSETTCNFLNCKTACIDGKFYVVSDVIYRDVCAYESKEGRWDLVGLGSYMEHHLFLDSSCDIDNIWYFVFQGRFIWYDTKELQWRYLKGLVGLPKFPPSARIRLANHSGKIAVFWDDVLPCNGGDNKKMIWCAEIALEKSKSYEIWGKVEWFDHVLTVPITCVFEKVLAVTV